MFDLLSMTDRLWLRRVFAVLGLIWLPVAVLIALVFGTIGHAITIVSFAVRELWDDLHELCVHDIPDAWRDLIFTLRTGDLSHA